MKKAIIAALLLFAARGHAQVAISASSITDSFEHPLAAAKLCFQPVNSALNPVGFRVGSTQIVPNEVCGTVTNGVLASGLHVAPNISGTFYHVYIKTAYSNQVVRDLGMTPITGSTWSLDTYDPSMAVAPGTIAVGTVTPLSHGASPTASITGGPSAYLLNVGIPDGAPGTAGATGAKGDKGDKGDTGAAGLTGDMSALLPVLPAVRNLYSQTFNPQQGGLVKTDGTLDHGFDGFGYGHYTINVAGVTTLVGNQTIGEPSAGGFAAMAFYDSAGAFISYTGTGSSPISSGTAVTVPSGAFTAEVSVRSGCCSFTPSTLVIAPGSSLPSYTPTSQDANQGTLDADVATLNASIASVAASSVSNSGATGMLAYQNRTNLPGVRNLFSDTTKYGGLVKSDGTLDHSYDPGYGHYEFNVTGFTQVKANFLFGSPSAPAFAAGAFYDVAGAWISSLSNGTIAAGTTITVPAGAVMLKVSTGTDSGVTPSANMLVNGASLPANYISPQLVDAGTLALATTTLAAVQASAMPFAGQQVFWTGDSIPGTGYANATMEAILGVTTVGENDGGGGVTMIGAFNTEVAANASNPTGPDVNHLIAAAIAGKSLIIVSFGTNNGTESLGSISDSATTLQSGSGSGTSFYGDCKAVANAIEAAIAINAPAKHPTVIVTTPYLQSRVSGATLTNIITAEEQVFGGLYGYPVLDMSLNSGITTTNGTLSDTVHINPYGGVMFGAAIAHFANAHAWQ